MLKEFYYLTTKVKRQAVIVKLFCKCMRSGQYRNYCGEEEIEKDEASSVPGLRIWLESEYNVLSATEARNLIKQHKKECLRCQE